MGKEKNKKTIKEHYLSLRERRWFKYSIRIAIAFTTAVTIMSLIGGFPSTINNFIHVMKGISGVVKGESTVGDIFKEEEITVVNIDPGQDCSAIINQWEPDENVYFDEEHKVRLVEGSKAGSMTFKKRVSSLLKFEVTLRSQLTTGINTNVSLKNKDGELKYAIGDGDFETLRYSYVREGKSISNAKTVLQSEIDNGKDISFKLDIIQVNEKHRAISSLVYTNKTGKRISRELEDMIILNPEKLSLSLGLGLDARKERNPEEVHIDVISCRFWETQPSMLFD